MSLRHGLPPYSRKCFSFSQVRVYFKCRGRGAIAFVLLKRGLVPPASPYHLNQGVDTGNGCRGGDKRAQSVQHQRLLRTHYHTTITAKGDAPVRFLCLTVNRTSIPGLQPNYWVDTPGKTAPESTLELSLPAANIATKCTVKPSLWTTVDFISLCIWRAFLRVLHQHESSSTKARNAHFFLDKCTYTSSDEGTLTDSDTCSTTVSSSYLYFSLLRTWSWSCLRRRLCCEMYLLLEDISIASAQAVNRSSREILLIKDLNNYRKKSFEVYLN